jgi:pyrimidine operon attenuation protein/uracil phosphoribosyltransferase
MKATQLPFEIKGADIVLVDDILYTGRTVRAALNELFDYGRPARVELAVLFDRGGANCRSRRGTAARPDLLPADRSFVLGRDDSERLTLSIESRWPCIPS